MIARTHAAGVEEVVVKRGADACTVSVSGQPLREVPAVRLAKEGGGYHRRRRLLQRRLRPFA